MNRPMHKRYTLCFTLLLLISLHTVVLAQKKVKTLEVSDTIVSAWVDRPGELYILTAQGQLQKFDADGKLLSVYSNKPSPTLFDPRDGSRLFAFFRSERQYDLMGPSLQIMQTFTIDSAAAVDPWLACMAGDHDVWILDAADWSLKKINTQAGSVMVEELLPAKPDRKKSACTFLRSYQGFVFLLDTTEGILIFNSVGKLVKTLPVKHIQYFNFLGEELYYLDNDRLKFFDLFTTEAREQKLPSAATIGLLTDERMFLIKHKSIDILYAPRE
ncbi:hypothetical protein [Ohtaekwangia sp.]|uniref:hypothetical protein n=1 Tax=Ohtaekwangia sp. TaxID=2066019 RepID=UPI002F93163A